MNLITHILYYNLYLGLQTIQRHHLYFLIHKIRKKLRYIQVIYIKSYIESFFIEKRGCLSVKKKQPFSKTLRPIKRTYILFDFIFQHFKI